MLLQTKKYLIADEKIPIAGELGLQVKGLVQGDILQQQILKREEEMFSFILQFLVSGVRCLLGHFTTLKESS